MTVKGYAKYLMVMAGLGGLLYGIDVGVIAAALPYIEKTSTYSAQDLSLVVAAVLLGSVISSLFAGMLAEWLGRKKLIVISALLFTLSIPVICSSVLFENGFAMLMLGRILQGGSAGLVGVVVPMYLAECLDADSRGKGTGMFQLMLTVGLVFAALVGLVVTYIVGSADDVVVTAASKVRAWQTIFWCSAVPGLVLFFGAFKLCESPRWLYRRGRRDEALKSLASNNGAAAAQQILDEMIAADEEERRQKEAIKAAAKGDSLLQRKYVIPFVLAVVVLACTQATGINSVLNYSVKIFQQAGLAGETANWADLAIKIVNMVMTVLAVSLVDRKGRTFLLKMGTLGIIVGLCGVGGMFWSVESNRVDVTELISAKVQQSASLKASVRDVVLESAKDNADFVKNGVVVDGMQLIVTYAQGDDDGQVVAEYYDRTPLEKEIAAAGLVYVDTSMAQVDLASAQAEAKASIGKKRSVGGDAVNLSDKIRKGDVKLSEGADEKSVVASLQKLEKNGDRVILNPAFDTDDASLKPLSIKRAEIGLKPSAVTGWLVTAFFVVFIAFYAAGPGVCVWLALSELMPNRIRANGMAIALLINQGVSTTIAGMFLPWVGATGYSVVFFCLAGCTVIYFITAAFFMPETKGRTLEEIEQYFKTGKMPVK